MKYSYTEFHEYSINGSAADSKPHTDRQTYGRDFLLRREISHRKQRLETKQILVTAQPSFNEELKGLYSSPNIVRVIKSRRMRWAGHVARMGKGRGVYSVLVGKPEGKRPLGRPRRRWDDNIRMELQEV